MEIRSKTIVYATMKKKTIRVLEEELETKIILIKKKVNKTELDLENLKAANENLVDIRQKKMEGVLLRSRARWVGEGEKITKYFCGLEKRNFVSKQMNKIIAKDGSFLSQTNAILEETKQFYEFLYKNRKTEDCKIEQFNKRIPKNSRRRS